MRTIKQILQVFFSSESPRYASISAVCILLFPHEPAQCKDQSHVVNLPWWGTGARVHILDVQVWKKCQTFFSITEGYFCDFSKCFQLQFLFLKACFSHFEMQVELKMITMIFRLPRVKRLTSLPCKKVPPPCWRMLYLCVCVRAHVCVCSIVYVWNYRRIW